MRYLIILLLPVMALAQFSGGTTKQIDQINNNTGTDITLNPVNKVLMPYLTSGELLYYNSGIDSLGNGTEGQILSITGGILAWIDPPLTSPTTTIGDIIYNFDGSPSGDARLAIGTLDQLLSSNGTIPVWIDPPVTSPITTEGDISIGDASGDPIRLPIGTLDQLLTSDGTTASWQAAPVSTTLTTKGDIQTYDTANQRLPVGTDGAFLVADSAETTGLKWSDSITGLISQAQFVGSLTYGEANCLWESTSGTEGSFPVDADCVASNIIGNIEAPTTNLPAIKIPSPVRTDGYYKVYAQGVTFQGGASTTCTFSMSSTGAYDEQGRIYTLAQNITQNSITGNFKFSTSGDKQIEIIVDRLSGTSGTDVCQFVAGTGLPSKFTVHFFPDSTALAAVQNKELTAATANELSATIVGTTATLSNYTWIDTITKSGAGKFNVNFVGGVFTVAPSCVANVTNPNGTRQSSMSTSTTGVARFNITDSSGTPTDDNFTIQCSKQGIDVNKSQVITGTFEGINSSELVVVRGVGNSGLPQTVNVTNIDFTETEDVYNAFDGTTFTAPKAGEYSISGAVRTKTSAIFGIRAYVNNSFLHYVAGDGAAVFTRYFDDIIKLNQGDTLTFRIGDAAGLELDNLSSVHYLTIQELPDTESIIKNLNDNNNIECETKTLQANTSTSGNVPDLAFTTLEIGKKYQAFVKVRMVDTNSTCTVSVSDGVTTRYEHQTQYGTGAPSARDITEGSSKIWQATSTTLNTTFIDNASCTLEGNGAFTSTAIQLCKLPDSTILN